MDKSHRKSGQVVVRRAPGKATEAILQYGPLRLRAALGRSGITSRKREGDGASPLGVWPVRAALLRPDRVAAPATRLPWRWLRGR